MDNSSGHRHYSNNKLKFGKQREAIYSKECQCWPHLLKKKSSQYFKLNKKCSIAIYIYIPTRYTMLQH